MIIINGQLRLMRILHIWYMMQRVRELHRLLWRQHRQDILCMKSMDLCR